MIFLHLLGYGAPCNEENQSIADSDEIPFPFAILNALGFFPEIEVVTLDNGDEVPQFLIKPEQATFDAKPAPGMKPKPEPGMKMKPEPRMNDFMKPEPRMKPEPDMMKPEPKQKSSNVVLSQSIPKPNFVLQNSVDTEKVEMASQDIFLDNVFEVNDISGVFPLRFEDIESFAVTQDESELLRAEMDLLSTPVTQMYAEAAYFALADARTQCYTDVEKFCSSSSSSIFSPSIISFSRALSSSHRRTEGRGKRLGFEGHGQDQRHDFHEEKEMNENHHEEHDHHKGHGGDHDHHGQDEDEREERDWEIEDFMIDTSVPIGWGATTDSCLYEHWNELSDNCKQSASRVQQLRFDFVDDDRWFGRPHFHLGFLGLLLLSLVCCLPGCGKHKRRVHEVHEFLEAIHANADLKAIVEASTGKTVPKIPPPPKKGKCVKVLIHLVLTFLLAFGCVHVSAMIVRCIIVNIAESNEQGELILPSPGVIALVMISVLGSTTLLTVLLGRKLMSLCAHAHTAPRNNDNSTSNDSSYLEEPFIPPTASTGTSRSSSSTFITPPTFPYIYNGFLFRTGSAPPAGYVPLRSEEEQPGSHSDQVELGMASAAATHHHSVAVSAPNIREQPIIAHFSTPVAII